MELIVKGAENWRFKKDGENYLFITTQKINDADFFTKITYNIERKKWGAEFPVMSEYSLDHWEGGKPIFEHKETYSMRKLADLKSYEALRKYMKNATSKNILPPPESMNEDALKDLDVYWSNSN